MTPLTDVALVVVAVLGTVVVAVRDPVRQVLAAGVFGLALALLFLSLGAPDVALSEIVVGTVAIPVFVLLALTRLRRDQDGDGDR